jgi:hypothetical protein
MWGRKFAANRNENRRHRSAYGTLQRGGFRSTKVQLACGAFRERRKSLLVAQAGEQAIGDELSALVERKSRAIFGSHVAN